MEGAMRKTMSSGSVHMEMEDIDNKFQEAYGEHNATEDQLITPWTVSVASGYSLLRDPIYNKGLSFTEKERDAHYLRGLLPPALFDQELQERNERLFYKLLIDNVEELLPVVYTPTVGEACQKYGKIYRRPQGLFISLKEKGKILEVLKNWPERNIQVIVVTDGERILGLGDLGCQGMGIPVGKLSLYTALGGIRPSACLPITIDVGTNNEQLLNDEFYIGLRHKRARGQEYMELLDEFMYAVKKNYGEKVLVQFEDFANHNAFELLARYSSSHLVFNDDIQGTASVVVAGLLAALKLVGGTLAEHTFLFLGAGEAGTGIAELIALEISKQTGAPVEETRKNIWLVDSKGLIVRSRFESLQHFKKPWAHDHESIKDLHDVVRAIRPTVLIGTSGVGKTFTKEVVEAMASINEKPLILALSNPTSQSECTAEEAYTWSQVQSKSCRAGRSLLVEVHLIRLNMMGKFLCLARYLSYLKKLIFLITIQLQQLGFYLMSLLSLPNVIQANNAYIFPGFGLGLIMSGTIRVHDDMLLAAPVQRMSSISFAGSELDLTGFFLFPAAALELHHITFTGLASRLPRPKDLVKFAESCMYSPRYRSYL